MAYAFTTLLQRFYPGLRPGFTQAAAGFQQGAAFYQHVTRECGKALHRQSIHRTGNARHPARVWLHAREQRYCCNMLLQFPFNPLMHAAAVSSQSFN